ncbi:hypothetical protein FP2506_16974 [Fulvimarina pelagi HTCC2506]|uniref:Uncharacterized protein n=1 Tax=Fulvimarina pelagi HTCC2506 TaxID=314231 RepID=Q0G2N5_9HYPH|nr:hypothetical protein FP2506_16974 [Fulvimarina pelagi HTCC2506]
MTRPFRRHAATDKSVYQPRPALSSFDEITHLQTMQEADRRLQCLVDHRI